jgi:hypothetical protein
MNLSMKKITWLLIVLLSASASFAQVRTFKWSGEMCEYTATYNSKKYSEVELRNTARLITSGEFDLGYHTMVFKYEDIAKLDVSVLDKEYAKKSAELKAMKIVSTPYWETVRQRKVKEMDQAYQKRRAETLAYTDPSVLRNYKAAPACNAKYAEPLINGGESLYKVWLEVNMASRSKNADPGRLKREFEAQNASPDREKYAHVEVMTFGWGNCANDLIEYDQLSSDGTYLKEFKKLFVRVRESCEQP